MILNVHACVKQDWLSAGRDPLFLCQLLNPFQTALYKGYFLHRPVQTGTVFKMTPIFCSWSACSITQTIISTRFCTVKSQNALIIGASGQVVNQLVYMALSVGVSLSQHQH